MRTCLLVFLIIIWLPLALFSIWTTNFNLTLGKADFWLKNFKEVGAAEKLSQALPGLLEKIPGQKLPPQTFKNFEEILGKVLEPDQIFQQVEQFLKGGELLLQGKSEIFPSLNLKEIRQGILEEPSLPFPLKQALLKDLPETLAFSQKPPQNFLNFVKLSNLGWKVGVALSFIIFLLIILLGKGSKGKLRVAGISFILLSLLLFLSLLAFSWANQILKEALQQMNLLLPSLNELAQDFLTQVLNDLKSLPFKEGLIGLGTGVLLLIISLFLPKKVTPPKPA